jgi:hypothetical protein
VPAVFPTFGPFKRGGFAASFKRTRAEELHAVRRVTSKRVCSGGAAGYSAHLALRVRVTFSPDCLAHSCSVTWSLRFDGVYATGKLLFEFKPLRTCSSQSHHWVTAQGGEAFAAIGLHVPEPPAFAAVGLHEQVEAIAVEELVLALSGLCRVAGGLQAMQ